MVKSDIKTYKTHTGTIFVDRENKLEFLSVGDYGKENNIKANFLGLNKEIYGVNNIDVDLKYKWVTTISTQKGCPMRCDFCDCHKYGYYGNVSLEEMCYQVETVLKHYSNIKDTERFNLHFARMGEPTFNKEVLRFTTYYLRELLRDNNVKADTIHPVVSTMLPRSNPNLLDFLLEWCFIKNHLYNGEAGLQFSINSTDNTQRDIMFNNMSLSLEEISELSKQLPAPVGRKYTLNFAVTKDTILDSKRLSELFDKDKFIVKITPIHETNNAKENGYDIGDSYTNYNVYKKFEEPLLEEGWEVIVFIPSLEEDSDRITCGNALIVNK